MRVTIVGAGQAGGTVARTLRAEGFTGGITVIGSEPHLPYERPPLSKSFLLDADVPRIPHLLAAEAWDGLGVDFRLGAKAERIDRDKRRLLLEGGESVSYDTLVLATGGQAAVPPITGLDEVPFLTLRSVADSLALRSALRTGGSLAVIGGGWIGLEVAAAAQVLGVEVMVLEAGSRLAARSAPRCLSDWLLDLHESKGVVVMTGATAVRVAQSDGQVQVHLADGRSFAAEHLLVGAGLSPADTLARQAGLVCGGGVVTDWCGRTDDPDVYAVGDVASFAVDGGIPRRLESWDNAISQSVACARAILGRDPGQRPVPWFWSDQFGHNVQLVGNLPPNASPVERRAPDGNGFSWFFLAEGRLLGTISVDDLKVSPIAKRLVSGGHPVSAERLCDPAVPLRDLLR